MPVHPQPVHLQPVRSQSLDSHLFVVGRPELLERGRARLRHLRGCRPPGLAADQVAEEMLADGASGVMVSLDGIVRVGGESPTGDGWLTVVAHPRGHFATAVLRLESGAVATVGRLDGADPLISVSVVASQAWQAELLASTALATGSDGAEAVLRAAGVPGLLVDTWDEARPVGAWDGLSAAGQPGLLASPA